MIGPEFIERAGRTEAPVACAISYDGRVERVVRKFASHAEADAADAAADAAMTGEERLQRLFELRRIFLTNAENPHGDEPRLERVHRVIKRPPG